jgi:hypothetical protein
MNRLMCCALVLLAGASLARGEPPSEGKDRLVVHEWGTFTSVSGAEGVALEWRPLAGPDDLPGFVHSRTAQSSDEGLRFGEVCRACHHSPKACGPGCTPGVGRCRRKSCVRSTVRMETPVIYFYSGRERRLRVKVDFPEGQITEWYPQALSVNKGIDWGHVLLRPGLKATFPRESGKSHYYPAREVDAVPVQVCGTANKRRPALERFLFYRGVGNFDLPLSARLHGAELEVGNFGPQALGTLIVFERRGDQVGVRVIEPRTKDGLRFRHTRRVARPLTTPEHSFPLAPGTAKMHKVFVSLLVKQGLYAKEAHAMYETWKDHWFEEGLRVFYVVPRQRTDELLPLSIEPRPDELVRVLVGRLELITPALRERVRKLVDGLTGKCPDQRKEAAAQLEREGRFAEPVLSELAAELSPAQRARLAPYLPRPAAKAKSSK